MQARITSNPSTRLLKGKPHILGPRCRPSAAVARRTQSFWTRAASEHESIAGTAPFHNAYIFLHTRLPPPSYPARVSSALQRTLQRATLRFGGYVNFAWAPEQRVLAPPSDEVVEAIARREVAPLVNRVANNGPELLAPVGDRPEQQTLL